MKAKIGNLEVILTQTLIIQDDLDSWVEFKVLNWDVKLNLVFHKKYDNPSESSFDIEPQEDYAKLIFNNWDGEGMSFREPASFGITEDRKVYLMAFGQRVGNAIKLDLQILLEAAA
ncbi:DUF6864 domain-containing function [Shewanella sp. 1180_01]|uniref:DUF6864 domain-containing function n=1 Tax=Shewanella sp. 1180_01 TaxID=2604451 RepID=UPI00406498D9